MKPLQDIIKAIKPLEVRGDTDFEVTGIHFDSRKISDGDIFFAIKGVALDGHEFIAKAIEKGAKAIACENLPNKISDGITYIKVLNSSDALGKAASEWYDHPSEKLNLVGITGTNGKTTCTTLLYDLFSLLGFPCALISTVENRINGVSYPSTHTTPDPLSTNKILHQAVEEGCEYAFMEVSSHGVDQRRIAGLHFKVAGFTNITHDHLDYHKTFENYLKAKKAFFDQLYPDAIAISNADDKNGKVMLQNTAATKKYYSLKTFTDYKGKIKESSLQGMLIECNGREFYTSLTGEFNAYNLLLVYGIANELFPEPEQILKAMSELRPVNGRFQSFVSPQEKIHVVVDYAHTPDALENVLQTLNKVRTKNEKLITVFGCGGDRDTQKRPKMGKIAAVNSDAVIITSDNPRSEDPEKIVAEIVDGIPAQYMRKYSVNLDRKEAFRQALQMAQSGDIILIAGKGHEAYQEIKGTKFPFDDVKIALELVHQLNK